MPREMHTSSASRATPRELDPHPADRASALHNDVALSCARWRVGNAWTGLGSEQSAHPSDGRALVVPSRRIAVLAIALARPAPRARVWAMKPLSDDAGSPRPTDRLETNIVGSTHRRT